jgi:hypothetical protein
VGEIATSLVDFRLKTVESAVAVDRRLVSLDVVRELDHWLMIIKISAQEGRSSSLFFFRANGLSIWDFEDPSTYQV